MADITVCGVLPCDIAILLSHLQCQHNNLLMDIFNRDF